MANMLDTTKQIKQLKAVYQKNDLWSFIKLASNYKPHRKNLGRPRKRWCIQPDHDHMLHLQVDDIKQSMYIINLICTSGKF